MFSSTDREHCICIPAYFTFLTLFYLRNLLCNTVDITSTDYYISRIYPNYLSVWKCFFKHIYCKAVRLVIKLRHYD